MTNLKNHLLGRGVFSSSHYRKEDFLVEYRGDIITKEECERRRRLYHNALEVFLFQLLFNGRLLWYVYCFIKFANIYVSVFSLNIYIYKKGTCLFQNLIIFFDLQLLTV